MQRFSDLSQPKKIIFGVGVSSLLLYTSYRLFKKMRTPHVNIPKYFISEEQAVFRSSQLMSKEIEYSVCLKLLPGDSYQGVVCLTFHAKYPLDECIVVDFEGQSIDEITISGEKLPKISKSYKYLWDGYRIKLPKEKIGGGLNSVTIKFTNSYSITGTGLHTYLDHTDKRQYIYSHCEPDHMHKIMPSFDQPDLKGKFKLFLILPKEWVGVSNELVNDRSDFDSKNLTNPDTHHHRLSFDNAFFNGLSADNHKIWTFATTKPISTYIFSVIAGPFCEYKCEKTYKNIPMSFYCRESLFKHLKSQIDDLLEITNLSMDFYENFFHIDFPFSKYDQIFCPEYISGAMENAGAVTINDHYIYRDQVSLDDLRWRGIVISHELSHMWFGDLVTMTWWEDLWLNESFAEFFSHLCLSRVKLTKSLGDFDIAFFSSKGSGYRCDQMRTTHPVSGKVKNTEEIRNYFDGITYSKGAAILKQLMFLIGEQAFGKALSVYFNKYQWGNTKLDDFTCVLNSEYEKQGNLIKLDEWRHEWLNTAGLNECYPIWDPINKGNNENLIIVQTAALKEFPSLRTHKMKIAFFRENGEIGEIKDCFLDKKNENTVVYDGSAGYKAILINYEDHSYIKIILDQHSIEFFKSNLKNVSHSLSRSMIWRSFYDMVRDGKLSSYEYAEIFERNIEYEDNETILSDIFNYASFNFSWTPKSYKKELGHKLFHKTYDLLRNEKNDSKIQIYKNYLIKFAYDHKDIDTLYHWLKAEEPYLKYLELSIYESWDIITAVHRSPKYTVQEKQEIFKHQAEKDLESCKTMEKRLQGIIATDKEKNVLWSYYLKEKNSDSVQLIEASMEGFNDEEANNEKYYDLYFAELIKVDKKREPEFSKAFFNNLFPNNDDFVYLKRKIDEVLGNTKENDITLRKFLAEQNDMIERRLNACEKFINSLKGNN